VGVFVFSLFWLLLLLAAPGFVSLLFLLTLGLCFSLALCVFFAIEHMSFVSGLAFVYPFFVAAVLSLVRDTYLLFLLFFFFFFFAGFCDCCLCSE
jgi:hypothetical protein